jgi:hypothetical protein
MGLGDRHNDPKVGQALKLFDRHFRHASMPELLECARRLSEIFGQDSVLLDLLQVRDCADLPANGTGIDAGFHSDEILQSEMRRIRAAESSSTETAPSFRRSTATDTDHFDRIKTLTRLDADHAGELALRRQVAGPANQLRAHPGADRDGDQ